MEELIKKLQPTKVGNEVFYSITDVLSYLEANTAPVGLANVLITPFYIYKGKKYEIYYKEFDIDKISVTTKDKNNDNLLDYFNDILASEHIRNDVASFAPVFNKDCLYFAVYIDG